MATNHYKLLGVHRRFTEAELKTAFRKLSSENHPDRFPGDEVKAAYIKDVNIAYSCLKSRDDRKMYDKLLALHGTKCGACKGEGVVIKQKGFKAKSVTPCTACYGAGYL